MSSITSSCRASVSCDDCFALGETSRLGPLSLTSTGEAALDVQAESSGREFTRRRRSPVSTLGSMRRNLSLVEAMRFLEEAELALRCDAVELSSRSKSFVRFLLLPNISNCFVRALCIHAKRPR